MSANLDQNIISAPAAPSPATANATSAVPNPGGEDLTPVAVAPVSGSDSTAAGGSFLERAQAMAQPAQPYLDKAAEAAKPYTDAAIAKGRELKDAVEGKHAETAPTESGNGAATNTTERSGEGLGQTASDLGEKAKSALGFGLAQLQGLASKIDAQTASGDQPGLISRVGAAYQSGVKELEKAVGGKEGGSASLNNAEEGGAPSSVTAGGAGSGAHPVMTTTNSLPHAESSPAVQAQEEREVQVTGEGYVAPKA